MLYNNLKTSVAMATYNGESFVRDQLESIINQTYPPDEIIICDDGSSDSTVEIIQSIINGTNIPIVLIKNEQNLGVTMNFEKAIKRTSGDIIFLSDQDDVWFDNKIERMSEPFLDKDVVLVYHDAVVVNKNMEDKKFSLFGKKKYLRFGQKRNIKNIINDIGIKGCTIAFNSCVKEIILPVDRQYWSHDHWIYILCHVIGKIVPLDEALMYYRIHDNNTGGGVTTPERKINITNILKNLQGPRIAYFVNKYDHLNFKLKTIKDDILVGSDKLDILCRETKKYIYLYNMRVEIQNMNLFSRIVSSTKLLNKGFYHNNFNGYPSYIRDLFKF